MPKFGMVIDLQKCVGCGACALACKTENNTQNRANGQSFNWADYLIETSGTFPNVQYENMPVLCNHCSEAACVDACPVTPKAMYKGDDNITMHNIDRCIGCRRCQSACPYSDYTVDGKEVQYSVISFNDFSKETHPAYRGNTELIERGTASGAEIAARTGQTPPHRTRYEVEDSSDLRPKGVVEKCLFCAHRTRDGQEPYCVEACPSGARVFGDLDNLASEISVLLRRHRPRVLKPEAGTEPNVSYIRNFRAPS